MELFHTTQELEGDMPKVADFMTKEVITVTPETTLRELAEILSKNNINGVPVVDRHDSVLGVVCESDLVNQNKPLHIPTVFFILDSVIPVGNPWRLHKDFQRISATTVSDIYSRPAVCVTSNTDLSEAARLMADKKLYTLPVVDAGRLVGILGKGDVVRALVLA